MESMVSDANASRPSNEPYSNSGANTTNSNFRATSLRTDLKDKLSEMKKLIDQQRKMHKDIVSFNNTDQRQTIETQQDTDARNQAADDDIKDDTRYGKRPSIHQQQAESSAAATRAYPSYQLINNPAISGDVSSQKPHTVVNFYQDSEEKVGRAFESDTIGHGEILDNDVIHQTNNTAFERRNNTLP